MSREAEPSTFTQSTFTLGVAWDTARAAGVQGVKPASLQTASHLEHGQEVADVVAVLVVVLAEPAGRAAVGPDASGEICQHWRAGQERALGVEVEVLRIPAALLRLSSTQTLLTSLRDGAVDAEVLGEEGGGRQPLPVGGVQAPAGRAGRRREEDSTHSTPESRGGAGMGRSSKAQGVRPGRRTPAWLLDQHGPAASAHCQCMWRLTSRRR